VVASLWQIPVELLMAVQPYWPRKGVLRHPRCSCC
jgi:hypothetical protein